MFKKIIVLAPHADDGEFGCGASITKLLRKGSEVVYVAFSCAEESVPENFPRDALRQELKNATKVLGIRPENCIDLKFPVRKFPEYRQEILEKMVEFNKTYKPDLIFLPSKYDTHQDHSVISQEGFRAFKKTNMLGYEVPWNQQISASNFFIEVSEEDLEKKMLALKEYKTQYFRDYAKLDYIKGLASTQGIKVGRKYVESFEVIRWYIS